MLVSKKRVCPHWGSNLRPRAWHSVPVIRAECDTTQLFRRARPGLTYTTWRRCMRTTYNNPRHTAVYTASLLIAFSSNSFQLFLNGGFPASFSLFLSFQHTADSKQMFNINNFLPMTGFELRTSGIGSNHSTNWATQPLPIWWHSLVTENDVPSSHIFL